MTRYFLICNSVLAKGDGPYCGLVENTFLFRRGRWEHVSENELNDRIMGYDPTEDSPLYRIGNQDIMEEIREITEEEAEEFLKKAQRKRNRG